MKNITLYLFLLISYCLIGQNGGDSCSEALSIVPGDFTEVLISQDTQGGEQGVPQPLSATWYVFVPEEDGLMSISSCASSTDTRAFVGTGDCGAIETQVSGDDDCGFGVEILDIAVQAGVSYYIEWDDRWSANSFDWSLTYTPASACQVPNELVVSSITDTTAQLSWEEVDTAVVYEWVIMAIGEDPSDFENIPIAQGDTTAGVLSATAVGLQNNTSYDAYVRAFCDNGPSNYSALVNFTTTCEVFVPDYLESFDLGSVPPDCWAEASNGTPEGGPQSIGSGSWGADDYLNDTASSGGMDNAARVNLFFNTAREWLISPLFNLSGSEFELVYNVGATQFNGQSAAVLGSDDQVQVLISIDDGASWQLLLAYTASNTPSHLGQEEIIDLSAYTGTARFAFWATEGTVNDVEDVDFFIDEFKVRSPLDCVAPELSYEVLPDCENDQFTVVVEVVDLGSSPSLTILDVQGGDSQVAENAGETFTFGPYPAGDTIMITAQGNNANCFVEQNISSFCAPENDVCSEAIGLPLGEDFEDQAIIGTNVAATDSGVAAPICSVYNGGDVWFQITVPTDAPLFLETRAATDSDVEDVAMEVYNGTCDNLSLIACDDDSGIVNFSLLEIDEAVYGGETIYVRIWENNNNSFGEFQISAYSDSSLSIADLNSQADIGLHPNPVETTLNLTRVPSLSSVIIVNALGQRILKTTQTVVDVSSLESGIYFVIVQDQLTSQTLRFVKI